MTKNLYPPVLWPAPVEHSPHLYSLGEVAAAPGTESVLLCANSYFRWITNGSPVGEKGGNILQQVYKAKHKTTGIFFSFKIMLEVQTQNGY